jgi:hypothetical protein
MQKSTVSSLDHREAVRRQQPNLLPELSCPRIFANAQDTGTKTLFIHLQLQNRMPMTIVAIATTVGACK